MRRLVVGKKSLGIALACALVMALGVPVGAAGVSLWTQNAGAAWMLEITRAFTQETGIAVELRPIGWATDQLFVAAAGGAMPDMYTHGYAALPTFAGQNLTAPLDDLLAQWDYSDEIVTEVLDGLRYEGRLSGLPMFGVRVLDLVYRKDFFANAGLDPNTPPKTWEDLVRYGRATTIRDGEGNLQRAGLIIEPGAGHHARGLFLMFMKQQGLSLFDETGVNPQLLRPEAQNALEYLVDLHLTHRIGDVGFAGNLSQGTTAMYWTDMIPFARKQENWEQMDVATFPYNGVPATTGAADFIALSPHAAGNENAHKFLEYIMHPDRHEVITQVRGVVPVFKNALEWEWVRETAVLPHYMNALSYLDFESHPRLFDYRDILTDWIMKALRGEEPPRNALVNANQAVANALK